jgi:hypothetical protein
LIFFFIFPLFSTCSVQVPNGFPRFPMCSPRVFPIAPRFNPICFAQSPPLLTCVGWVFFARGIRPGQKWWQTLLGRFFFIFLWFPMCSHYVPFKFSMGSHQVPQVPNVFSITLHFYPICFGKCCPCFTYIGGPKERNSILQNTTFYFGEPL